MFNCSPINIFSTCLSALRSYWNYYFTIRQLTLYDFENEITLSEDFDRIVNNFLGIGMSLKKKSLIGIIVLVVIIAAILFFEN